MSPRDPRDNTAPLSRLLPWFAALLGLMIVPGAARAESGRPYLGLHGNIFFPSNSSLALSPGISFTYPILPTLSVGAIHQSYTVSVNSNTDEGNATISTSTSIYGIDGVFQLPASLPGLSAGVRTGWMTRTTDASAADTASSIALSTSSTSIYVCPRLGYDYFFSPVSIGGEFNYLAVLGNAGTRIVGVSVVAKLWF